MKFKILSDISKQYLLEEDAIKGFRMAVENGQSRLALSILSDIIEVYNDVFVEMFSEDNVDEEKSQEEIESVEQKIEKKAKEKEPDQKITVKKEIKTAEEK